MGGKGPCSHRAPGGIVDDCHKLLPGQGCGPAATVTINSLYPQLLQIILSTYNVYN